MYKSIDIANNSRKWLVLFVSIVCVILLGVIDHYAGKFIDLSVFYLIPVAYALWFSDRRKSLITAIIAVIVWEFEEFSAATYSSQNALNIFNVVLRLIFFVAALFFMSRLKHELDIEKDMARTDALTGVVNRRFFTEILSREIEKARKAKAPLTLVYFDIDSFKQINDKNGHDYGDEVLKETSSVISSALPEDAVLARIGGDEFSIILPGIDKNASKRLMMNIREILNARGGALKGVTYSFGIVTAGPIYPIFTESLVTAADRVMYKVKKQGKNSVRSEIYRPVRAKKGGNYVFCAKK